MKTLLLIFLFAISASAQLPDTSKFKYVGSTGTTVAFTEFNSENAGYVVFRGLLARVAAVEKGAPLLDPNEYSITRIRANCSTYAFSFLETKGVTGGVPYENVLPPNTNVAPEKSIMRAAIDSVCKRDLKTLRGKDGK